MRDGSRNRVEGGEGRERGRKFAGSKLVWTDMMMEMGERKDGFSQSPAGTFSQLRAYDQQYECLCFPSAPRSAERWLVCVRVHTLVDSILAVASYQAVGCGI